MIESTRDNPLTEGEAGNIAQKSEALRDLYYDLAEVQDPHTLEAKVSALRTR